MYAEPDGWVAIRAQAADVDKHTAAAADEETDNILDMLAAMDSPAAANVGPAEPGKRRPINTNEIRKHAPAKPESGLEPEPEPEPDAELKAKSDGDDGEEKPTSHSKEETMLARVAALSVQQLLNQKVLFIQDRLVRVGRAYIIAHTVRRISLNPQVWPAIRACLVVCDPLID